MNTDLASARAAIPPITKGRRNSALRRLAEARAMHFILDFGNGPVRVGTGIIHLDDLTAENGYAVVLEGYDRFGWPVGHADSPLAEAASAEGHHPQ